MLDQYLIGEQLNLSETTSQPEPKLPFIPKTKTATPRITIRFSSVFPNTIYHYPDITTLLVIFVLLSYCLKKQLNNFCCLHFSSFLPLIMFCYIPAGTAPRGLRTTRLVILSFCCLV